jgi:parallel beta-helix repeat protein
LRDQKTALILLLILCFAVVSISKSEIVKAEGTIYIRADGSVDGTDRIQRDGDTYTLISDISGSIVVERDNVVLNGVDCRLHGDGSENGITLRNINNNTIRNFELSNFNIGIVVMGSDNNKILQNIITDNFRGLDLTASENNTISENNISCNTDGIALENVNNSIVENTITNNTNIGIFLYGAGYNNIVGNYIENSGTGIQLVESYNNTIFQNKIIGNGEGIGFGSGGGYSTVHYNLIADNGYAFTFWANSHNTIYGNNLINNTNQVHAWISSNNWDYEPIGNYWSDYNGTDSNGDGIGDTPYMISTSPEDYGDADNYPLMEPVDDTLIPEFPSWTPLLIALVAVVAITFVYRHKLNKQRRFDDI